MRWLRYLNPLTPIIDYMREARLRDERRQELDRLDRQDLLDTMRQITESHASAMTAQSKVLERFLASFDTAGSPRVREYDEEVDADRYLRNRDSRTLDAYTALVEKLDRFGFDDDTTPAS